MAESLSELLAGLQGMTTPRLFTPPLRELTPETSLGFEVLEFAKTNFDWNPHPWQAWWLTHALELLPNGKLRFSSALLLISRQNGKSELVSILALWQASRRRSVLYSSASLDTAFEQFEMTLDKAEEAPGTTYGDIKSTKAAGRYAILFNDLGVKYKVVAANGRGGRGLTKIGLILVDELREHTDFRSLASITRTMLTVPDAFMVMLSNAKDHTAVPLHFWRNKAQSGEDPTLFYAEWSAPDGCEIDDIDAIRQANPSLGHPHGVLPERLESDIKGPVNDWRVENLCQFVESMTNAIDPAAWELCRDDQPIRDKEQVALGFDIKPDLTHATCIAAVPLSDGRVRVEVVAVYESPEEARQGLPELLERIKPTAFGWFPSGPASGLAADLSALRRSKELKNVSEVCMSFAEQVASSRIAHNGDEMLTRQTLSASKLREGDRFRFGRTSEIGVDSLYAAAAAVAIARSLPAPARLRFVAGR